MSKIKIELRYFKNDSVRTVSSSLNKLLSLNGKKLAKLAKQNIIHNHSTSLFEKGEIDSPRFSINRETNEDNHPEGRRSIYCDKKYKHGKAHGKFKCTVPSELMYCNLEVELDPSALTVDSLKHFSGVREIFSIPLDELFNSEIYETLSMWLEDNVEKRRINYKVKRQSNYEKVLEVSLIKELVEEAQEKYIGGKNANSLPQALNYVKKFRLVFNL